MQTPTPTPSPSSRWDGQGSGYSPSGTASPAPAGSASPSPAGAGSPGFQIGTTTQGKSIPTFVYYDPTTGRLVHTGTPKPTKLPDYPLSFGALDPKTKAYLQTIVDSTNRPTGRTWGTAANLWNYLQTQRRLGAGSVWDLMDEVATTAPRKPTTGAGSAPGWAKGSESSVDIAPGAMGVYENDTGTTNQVAPPVPTTNTAVYKTITSFTPADAESLLTSALTNAIGREPSAGEVRHFLGKLRSAARKNPSVSKVVSHNDGLGNTSQTTKQSPGFDSTSASMLAKNVSEGGAFEKEHRQNQANEFFNSFLGAIQSPTQVG